MTLIPVAGVIGCPIAHSKSPKLHGYWLSKYEINGYYIPLHVTEGDLERVVKALPAMGFRGCNVTIPHKERALALADIATDRARKIGAANTLTFKDDGQIHADNTDAYGFMQNIRQVWPEWSASVGPITVLGAGGAARAVVVALLEEGATDIRIVNRTRDRAEDLVAAFGKGTTAADWADLPDLLPDTATLVNTTALGMAGGAPLDLSLDSLPKESLVTDIVYTPLNTNLLMSAAQRGCKTVDGLGMLLHQGAPGFAQWFGVMPEVDDDLRRVMLEA
ncbi:shikimate dehydrogenase [Roseicitreum antarcticum]|uniref:Shikimate dehydrogenase (NADP(+)) n=1 Tax=Roseicitreum antarcticum TaxID=564137 RepID=A0A1H2QZT6_9RHOB|nr:shikimate dehydrogenase [Roseicitreum antarcticum]SDW12448.1 shikimate dehydrogenase [Roseicitreum antarcticum]